MLLAQVSQFSENAMQMKLLLSGKCISTP
uniref:Uncharacterized protein n=1 Tax=Anguilla anguilla TaxID=7936 RepID=A0A0E9T3U3_ANGAN